MRRGSLSLTLGIVVAAVAFAAVAYADDISNNLDATVDAVAEVMPLTVGGSDGTTLLYVVPQNGDGKNGCNLTGSTTLVVSVSSSNTSVATVGPSSVSFTSCGATPTLTVTPVSVGSATISVSQTSNNTGATFNFAPAGFTVNVTPPPNAAPSVTVAGVTGGASYAKGSVPAATCQVTDAEDGNSSFAATLGAITGPYASDGIGQQTASCSYTDAGGLTAAGSETYNVVDPSAPNIGYGVLGTLGDNGWYRSDVSLTWNVSEPESPNSLLNIGCVDQNVTTDQNATDYSCSATSAGGSAGPVTVSIKRDATPPTVSGAPTTLPNAADWYNTDVSIQWTCSDATSSLAAGCPANSTIAVEGTGLSASSGNVYDNAGNVTNATSSPAVKIDKTVPNVSASTSATPINVVGTDWYKDGVTFDWSASDPALADTSAGSGVASGPTPQSSTFDLTGANQSASSQATDNAGNTGTGTLTGVNVDASNPMLGTCPAGGPFILNSGSQSVGPIGASDTGSGVDALASTLSGSIETSSVGTKTVTFTAYDNVGHSASKSCDYYVNYSFSGFFAPINRPNTMNVSKAGQAIPLKWRLTDALGTPVTNLGSVTVSVTGVSCALGTTTDEIEEVAAGASSLQNLGDGYYQFNWKSPTSYAGSCKSLNLRLGEEATARTNLAYISFKK